MALTTNPVIWQWNCISFPKRKAALQQFIKSSADQPAVILLQERLTAEPALRAYRTEADHSTGTRGIATLISKKIRIRSPRGPPRPQRRTHFD